MPNWRISWPVGMAALRRPLSAVSSAGRARAPMVSRSRCCSGGSGTSRSAIGSGGASRGRSLASTIT
ncbi:hypothetical protein OJJOAM_004961 [Cupriavidus sp. H18C1]